MKTTEGSSSWFRLHHLYYLLAAFELLTVAVSLNLSWQILEIYTESVEEQREWSERQVLLSRLGELASAVNAPGNDVLASGNVVEESERLENAWLRYKTLSSSMRHTLLPMAPETSRGLLEQMDQANLSMQKVHAQAQEIFAHIERNETSEASACMSRMDQNFATALGALGQLNRQLSRLQLRRLREESGRATRLGQYEWLILALVLCMVIGIVIYGQVLAARAVRFEQERLTMHEQLVDASRRAGMAEVATGVLHNVGNVLNSINVSANILIQQAESSRISTLRRASEMIQQHEDDLGAFLTEDKRGKNFPRLLHELSANLDQERTTQRDELDTLLERLEHVKEIVHMQQAFANVRGATELVNPIDLVEDAIKINDAGLTRHRVEIIRDFDEELPTIKADRHKILQILINLISNGKYAVTDSDNENKLLNVRFAQKEDHVHIVVTDNGIGIPQENLTKIFNHGFTTKRDGNGFGLHSSALSARELGGSLSVHSDGPGQGATFTLRLPMECEELCKV